MRIDPVTRELGPDVDIIRIATSYHGTSGILTVGGNYHCFTLEPPDRNNEPNFSCIPAGIYIVRIRWSKKYGWHYHVTDVEGRSFVLTHSGNVAGDRKRNLLSHSWGCILLGKSRGLLYNQWAVLSSRPAVRDFMYTMCCKQFKLEIKEAY